MHITHPIRLLGTGKYLPGEAVRSDVLEERLGIPPGWAMRYSGVAERHYRQGESLAYMGAQALEQALATAGLVFGDLDLLICGSATFDYPIPSQASVLKHELEQRSGQPTTVATLDVDSTCLSFVSGFDLAARLLDGRRYRRIAVVSAEVSSNGLNPTDWEIATLFGDGAGAAVLAWDDTGTAGVIHADMKTYSEGVFHTIVRGGGHAYFFRDHPYDPALHSFHMEGIKLLRLAKRYIPVFMEAFFAGLDSCITDVDLIIPHQASKTGIEVFEQMYPFAAGQVFSHLETHGNCIAASIPMALHDAIAADGLQRGQTCLICGTSAGFSIGGVLFTY
ncbi:MAG: beta-ketoacyl-ACP synthase III [Bacteroidia bacterium]